MENLTIKNKKIAKHGKFFMISIPPAFIRNDILKRGKKYDVIFQETDENRDEQKHELDENPRK